jgi:carbonic anhydrase
MSEIDALLANNRQRAGTQLEAEGAAPKRRVAIVTCMDARIDVYDALGLSPGEAHVLRNAGGVITDDVIRSLAISQRRLGTREVMVIQHTQCGMMSITDEEFAGELEEAAGEAPPFAIGSFADLETSLSESIQCVRESPFLLHTDAVRGFVYDIESHRLSEVSV